MKLRHVVEWTVVELRRLWWLAVILAGLLGATAALGPRSGGFEVITGFKMAQLFVWTTLFCLLVLGGLFVSAVQAKELGGAARRHLFSLGMTPAELLLAKLVAAVCAVAAAAAAVLAAKGLLGELGPEVDRSILVAVGMLALLNLLAWSANLLSRSWPGVGTALVFGGVTLYLLALDFVPGFDDVAGMPGLFSWLGGHGAAGSGAELALTLRNAVGLVLTNLLLAWMGQRRVVE